MDGQTLTKKEKVQHQKEIRRSLEKGITVISHDTIFDVGIPIAIIKDASMSFDVFSLDSVKAITVKEDYYLFPNGKKAYPDLTLRSKLIVAQRIINNELFGRIGLDYKSVDRFVAQHSQSKAVLQIQRFDYIEEEK